MSKRLGWIMGAALMAAPGALMAQDWVEGVRNGEDLMRIPGTDWVVVSGMASAAHPAGLLSAVHVGDRRVVILWPTDEAPAGGGSDGCAAPPDAALLSLHGLDLRPARGDTVSLLAVNHGGRESVEFFDLDLSGDAPTAVWTGCAVMPGGVWPNDVAALPDGGFAVTNMFDPANAALMDDLKAGTATGNVLRWSAQTGFAPVPGTQLVGPNGLVAAADGSRIYVAEWGTGTVVRVDLTGDAAPARGAALSLPDNLNWTDAGTLLVTGQDAPIEEIFGCFASPAELCRTPWVVSEMDPETLEASVIASDDAPKVFGNATGAIRVGGSLWIGTSRGDRLAIR